MRNRRLLAVAAALLVGAAAVPVGTAHATTYVFVDRVPSQTSCTKNVSTGKFEVRGKGIGRTVRLPKNPAGAMYYMRLTIVTERQKGDGTWVQVSSLSNGTKRFNTIPQGGVNRAITQPFVATKSGNHRVTVTAKLKRVNDGGDQTIGVATDTQALVCF